MKVHTIIAAVLLGACASASAQITPLPMALCAGWEGERVCELLQEDAQIRVLRCTFPPGVGHEMHYHPPHFGYVLEGDSVMRTRARSCYQNSKKNKSWKSFATPCPHLKNTEMTFLKLSISNSYFNLIII